MITLNSENFEKFRPLLTVPDIHTLNEKPMGNTPPPCTCSQAHGVTLIGTMMLGEGETGPTKDIHICNVCHGVYKDDGQTPVYGRLDTFLEGVVRKHGTVHLFLNDNAKRNGFLITAMQAIHEAVNRTQLQGVK